MASDFVLDSANGALRVSGDFNYKVTSGSTIYYADVPTVSASANIGSVASGSSLTRRESSWILSAGKSYITQTSPASAANVTFVDDVSIADTLTVTGAATLSSTLGVTGISTLTGGVGPAATKARALNIKSCDTDTTATLASYGTDAAAADNKTVYLVSIFVPVNCTVTGIATLNGTNVTTDKFVNYLFNASGTALGQTLAAGTTPTPADTFQETDLIAPVAITGPAVYFIGRQHNGTTIGFQSIPTAKGHQPLAGSVAGTSFGAETSVVPPTTFTADKGPFGYLY